jgi:hypothetical protein
MPTSYLTCNATKQDLVESTECSRPPKTQGQRAAHAQDGRTFSASAQTQSAPAKRSLPNRGLGNSSYFAGHDDPHFGQTFGLNTIGNLLGLVGVALIDRWYDLVISRSFKLIPECLEVSRRFGVGAGHAS